MSSTGIVFPDYRNSILNVVSSILKSFSVSHKHAPLSLLDNCELASKKRVVLIVLDGLGYELLNSQKDKDCSFLKSNLVGKITSVFPSTTTSAITSFMTEMSPAEHGVLGWTLFYKEYFAWIDYFLMSDHGTRTSLDKELYTIYKDMGLENIFERISRENPKIDLSYLMMDNIGQECYWKPANRYDYKNEEDFFIKLLSLINKKSDRREFIFAYMPDPDHIEHGMGTRHNTVSQFLNYVNRTLLEIKRQYSGEDTTILITADHGLVDIDRYRYVNKDKELFDSLIIPTFPEQRFSSFFVKRHKEEQFLGAIEKYKSNFNIYSRDEFFNSGLLGPGNHHFKLDDFIGDYVAVATGKECLTTLPKQAAPHEFAAHHSGLTSTEMFVPLIRVDI